MKSLRLIFFSALICSCATNPSQSYINDLVGTNSTQYKVFEVNGKSVHRRAHDIATVVPYAIAPSGENTIKFIYDGEDNSETRKYITVNHKMNADSVYSLRHSKGTFYLVEQK